jgi:type II secretory ATPase GspE/PulE/Tfp pilus assembly ATPase PilB-like protein
MDPDIILVGEIRDTDTANVAVNASLTGHMVLTTIHANDAASAILRLVDLGVVPRSWSPPPSSPARPTAGPEGL